MDPQFDEVRALVFEPYTLFRVRPMRGPAVNVTEAGYRLGNPPAAWPLNGEQQNVFVFGGSTAFGYGVMDQETIPSRLADEVRALVPGIQISIYNFATPNHASVQERIRLEQLVLNGHRPGVAIFLDGFSEFISPYYEPLTLKRYRYATASGWGLLRALRERLQGFLLRGESSESECRLPDPGEVVTRYLRNVRLISAVCREFAVRPLFVWQPVPCYGYSGPSLREAEDQSSDLLNCVRSGYEMMNARRAKDFDGEQFLWLADMQQGRTENLYIDADHYTPAFSKDIAALIARHLTDHAVVK